MAIDKNHVEIDGEQHEEEEEEEEEDYMSMSFAEEKPAKIESSIQRRARKQKEAEIKARPKSKEQLAADEAKARDEGLATSIDKSNKGFKMMEKLGFKGGALGKEGSDARTEPIALDIKEGKGGIGLDSDKKRKIREQAEGDAERVKAEEGDYRERMRLEKEQKRLEGQLIGAMSVAERLDEYDTTTTEDNSHIDDKSGKPSGTSKSSKPLQQINVLWRGLVRHRLEKERERRMRHDLQQSLSRRPAYDDPSEDAYDKQAIGKEEAELEEEDPELDDFNAQDLATRLSQLVMHLRSVHNYCFFCKYQYPDAQMEGCPGITEEDHE